jgi:hypothetical protein
MGREVVVESEVFGVGGLEMGGWRGREKIAGKTGR